MKELDYHIPKQTRNNRSVTYNSRSKENQTDFWKIRGLLKEELDAKRSFNENILASKYTREIWGKYFMTPFYGKSLTTLMVHGH